TFSTKSSNQNIIVFFNKVQTPIIKHQSCDLRTILFLPDILSDGRVWLFRFNTYFCHHKLLCAGSISKRFGVQGYTQMCFLVLLIMPLLVPSVTEELPG
ncbi:hypothetical protein GW7_01702, partial [Heterocephalus glaber]